MTGAILAAFAAFRVAQMMVFDDGPFDLLARWRDFIGVDKQATWVQRGFGCPDCISFWTSLMAAVVLGYLPPHEFILRWLAIAGMALLLNRLSVRR